MRRRPEADSRSTRDFTVATGELTPTLKVKRNVVAQKFAEEIEAIYTK